jgi:ATP-binding cassette subfamily C (CFTR/MRP) protein 1
MASLVPEPNPAGAGKSSCLQALFRLVELCGGNITVDGIDISTIGLDTLRQSITAIPQEPFLFSGTMRDKLDPQGTYSDAALNDALKRCGLLERQIDEPNGRSSKFRLDAQIADEGKNLS